MEPLIDKDIVKVFTHVDQGFWTVYVNEKHEVYVQSSDFRHDAMLKIQGDFEDLDSRKEYAQLLCNRLNTN